MTTSVVFILFVLLAASFNPAFSQIAVFGSVRDHEGVPVDSARVAFILEADTTQVFANVTDIEGHYTVTLDHRTAVEEGAFFRIPADYQLLHNFPNPFNPSTLIPYALPRPGPVELSIYNILGHNVRTLVHTHKEAGWHTEEWDGRDRQGRGVSAGVYLYRMKAGKFVASGKMTIIDGTKSNPPGPASAKMLKPTRSAQPAAAIYSVKITGVGIEPVFQMGVSIPEDGKLDFVVVSLPIAPPVNAPLVLQPNDLCSDYAAAAVATFFDAHLEATVRSELGIGSQDVLTCGLLLGVMSLDLDVRNAGPGYLVGVQNLTNLTELGLAFNGLTDISVLSGLTNLTRLTLDYNANLSNIQPLLDNAGLARAGNRVDLSGTNVACADVAVLKAKLVTVTSDCP